MPRIAPKTVAPRTKVRLEVPAEIHALVEDYARHLGGDTDAAHVYAEAAKTAILGDKEFMKQRPAA
jgi:hypothetical protein